MGTIYNDKTLLRRSMRLMNRQLSSELKQSQSSSIWDHIQKYPPFSNAKTILIYWSMDTEVSTRRIVQNLVSEKNFLLPVVVGDTLVLRLFSGMENMVPEPVFGILEPEGPDFVDYKKIELVIVPGLAFDTKGNRLGRGKGYYDKLLNQIPWARTIGICFSHQLVGHVPVEGHDVTLNSICTPEGIIEVK